MPDTCIYIYCHLICMFSIEFVFILPLVTDADGFSSIFLSYRNLLKNYVRFNFWFGYNLSIDPFFLFDFSSFLLPWEICHGWQNKKDYNWIVIFVILSRWWGWTILTDVFFGNSNLIEINLFSLWLPALRINLSRRRTKWECERVWDGTVMAGYRVKLQ